MTSWIIDKSALVRLGSSPDADEWASKIHRGLVRIATVTRLEVGYSARTAADLTVSIARPPLSSMPIEYLTRPSKIAPSRSRSCWRTAASTARRRCLIF